MIQAFIHLLHFLRVADIEPGSIRVTIEFKDQRDGWRAKHVIERECHVTYSPEPQQVTTIAGIEVRLVSPV